jgi:hypothetical protein
VNSERLDGLFSARQLVEMASTIPARVARIDDKVGRLAPGMLADLFLVHGNDAAVASDPYHAITAGNITNIDLVMIGGVAQYGDAEMLHKLNLKTEPLTVCGVARALNVDALPNGSFAQVEARLKEKMKAVGSELAPLAECVP